MADWIRSELISKQQFFPGKTPWRRVKSITLESYSKICKLDVIQDLCSPIMFAMRIVKIRMISFWLEQNLNGYP